MKAAWCIWFRISTVLASVVCFLVTSGTGSADVIYSSLGTLQGFGEVVNPNRELGMAFVVRPNGPTYYLDSIDLAIGLLGGFPVQVNKVDIRLMSTDDAFLPNETLETFHLVDQMGFWGFHTPPITATSVEHPVLLSGKIYWVVATAPEDLTAEEARFYHVAWNYNADGKYGLGDIREGDEDWRVQYATHLAFSVHGTPVPEPASGVLLGLGLLGFALRRATRVPWH